MNYTLFGIPIRIKPSFFLLAFGLAGIWAYQADFRRVRTPVFISIALVVFLGVLIHELGHAIEAKRGGAKPTITMHGLGGHTISRPHDNPWRRFWISAAGVTYELVAAAAAFVAWKVWFEETFFLQLWQIGFISTIRGTVGFFLLAFAAVNLYWALINLVPFGGMDGAHLLEHALHAAKVPRPKAILLLYHALATAALVAVTYHFQLWIFMAYVVFLAAREFPRRVQAASFEADERTFAGIPVEELHAEQDYETLATEARQARQGAKSVAFKRWAAKWELEALSHMGDEVGTDALLENPGLQTLLTDADVGKAYRRLGRHDQAAERLGSWLEENPDAAATDVALLASVLIETDQAQRAVDLLTGTQGANVDTRTLAALHRRAWQQGERSEAEALRALIEERAEDDLFPIAYAFKTEERHADALALLNEAYEERPDGISAGRLAWALAGGDEDAEARAKLDEAFRRGIPGPNMVSIHTLIHEAGHYEVALHASSRFGEFDDLEGHAHFVAWFNHACTLARLGRDSEAVETLRRLDKSKLARLVHSDEDLDSLRERPDFRELVAGLES